MGVASWLCLAAVLVEGDKCPQCCPDSAFLQGEPFFLNTIAYNSNKIRIAACLSPPPLFLYASTHVLLRLSPTREDGFKGTIGSFPKCSKVFLKVGMLNKWCKYSSSLWQPYSCCPSSSSSFFFFLPPKSDYSLPTTSQGPQWLSLWLTQSRGSIGCEESCDLVALDWHRSRKILVTSERLQPENYHANLVTDLSGVVS